LFFVFRNSVIKAIPQEIQLDLPVQKNNIEHHLNDISGIHPKKSGLIDYNICDNIPQEEWLELLPLLQTIQN
jgi:hypothetical protein